MTPIKTFSSLEEMREYEKKLLDEGSKPGDGKYPSDYVIKLQYAPSIRIFRGEWTAPVIEIGRTKYFSSAYYIHDYYPKNRCPNVDSNIEIIRNIVYKFKDGRNTQEMASLLTDAVKAKGVELTNVNRQPNVYQ